MKLATAILGCMYSVAFGQVQVAPPVAVPATSCPQNCIPTEADSCCDAGILTCARTDFGPYLSNTGTLTLLTQRIECENCFSCCPCCPVLLFGGEHAAGEDCCDCSEIPSATCQFSIALTHTEAATVTLSTTLEATAGAAAVASIKTALETTLGITVTRTYSFTGTCGWTPLGACADGLWKEAFMEFTSGRVSQMDHEWSSSGVWVTDCWIGSCPLVG